MYKKGISKFAFITINTRKKIHLIFPHYTYGIIAHSASRQTMKYLTAIFYS